jgi:HemY protein
MVMSLLDWIRKLASLPGNYILRKRSSKVVRYLIIILLGLLAAIGVGALLSNDTGLLIFSFADYNVQTSLSFFILASLLLFILVYFIVRVVGSLIRLPKSIKRWSKHRRHRRSERYLSQGILSMIEEDWRDAEESFQRGARESSLPLVNYLAAARAAQRAGAIERRDHYLRLAHEDSPEASLVIGITQAKLQLSQCQNEQAYATLKHLDVDKDSQNQVNALMLEAASELNEWPEALRILNDPKSKKILPADQLKSRQLTVYAGLLQEAGKSRERNQLEETWGNIPRKLKEEFYLIEVYVRARLNFPDTSDCEELLRKILKNRWDDNLVSLYGLVEASNKVKQIQFAERLLSGHANDAVLLLSLGRLCKGNNLWGKALGYLEDSLSIQASAEAYQELALLLEQQGDHTAAGDYYRKGLALATGQMDADPLPLLDSPGNDNAVVEGARKIV